MFPTLIRRTVPGLAIVLLFVRPITAEAQVQSTITRIDDDETAADYKSEPQGLIKEPDPITRASVQLDRHVAGGGNNNGFYLDSFNMIPGAGWVSGGPGYRRWSSNDGLIVDASAALSWHGYQTAQGRIEMPRLARSRLLLGSQVFWQDYMQVEFYGEGSDAPESAISEYRIRATNVIGYATIRPRESVYIDATVGWLEPSVLPRSGSFESDSPDTRDVFPEDIVFTLAEQPTFIHSRVTMTIDALDFPGHLTRGGAFRVAAADYSDRDAHLFSFRRYEAEGVGLLPMAGSRVVLGLHGWVLASDTGEGQTVPFYLQPSIGGSHSLRGYDDYRFHDDNLLLVNAEARVAMMTHLDVAFFFDAGNVASRLGDLDFDKQSYGAGLRLHSRRETFVRFDVARGDEGWRALFKVSEPLNFKRLSRRTATAPFVP
jgi:hypothetical protein